jgi:hypothetical protein
MTSLAATVMNAKYNLHVATSVQEAIAGTDANQLQLESFNSR